MDPSCVFDVRTVHALEDEYRDKRMSHTEFTRHLVQEMSKVLLLLHANQTYYFIGYDVVNKLAGFCERDLQHINAMPHLQFKSSSLGTPFGMWYNARKKQPSTFEEVEKAIRDWDITNRDVITRCIATVKSRQTETPPPLLYASTIRRIRKRHMLQELMNKPKDARVAQSPRVAKRNETKTHALLTPGLSLTLPVQFDKN